MSDVQANLVWRGGMRFTGTNAAGLQTEIDGDHKTAASPVELLLQAIGSCSAVDIVLILDKMRTPATRLEVSLDADRHSPEPRYLTRTRLRFDIWGDRIKPEKATRAVQLSLVKYCSVFNSLRSDMLTEAEFRLHQPDAQALGDYTAVPIGECATD
ncbi:MAG: OsmC family protein [Acidobacteriota bacterium]